MGRVVPGGFPDERNSTTPPRRRASGNRATERVRAAFGLQNAHRWKRRPCFAANWSAGWIGGRDGFMSMVGLVVGWLCVVAQRDKQRACQHRADGTACARLAGRRDGRTGPPVQDSRGIGAGAETGRGGKENRRVLHGAAPSAPALVGARNEQVRNNRAIILAFQGGPCYALRRQKIERFSWAGCRDSTTKDRSSTWSR